MGAARRSYANYWNKEPEDEKQKGRVFPGPITNDDILEVTEDYYKSDDAKDIYNTILKPEMRERFDYKIMNAKQWEYLYNKYKGVLIEREKYKPEHYIYYQVEVYFQKINLILLPKKDEFDVEKITKEKPIFASKRWTMQQLKERVISVLNLPKYGYQLTADNFRLWKLDPVLNYESVLEELRKQVERIRSAKVNNTDPNVEENTGIDFPGMCLELFDKKKLLDRLDMGSTDRIILEMANEKGEYIFRYAKNIKFGRCEFCNQERPLLVACKCKEVFYCSGSCLKKDERFHAERCTAIDEFEDLSAMKKTEKSNMGLTGLQNLGNTCFMNSGLQCLSNTWALSEYFLENRHVPEINDTNVLGLKGKMARSYAKLIKLMWYDNAQFVSPWEVKRVVGTFHTAFSGFAQQDSQELISTILDALHEDLNRVKKKPYVEQKTTTDPNDDSVSVDNWYNHLARNQSIIVDLMHGQYKSVVNCPLCQRYSVTFDPFSVISLPVPAPKEHNIVFYYVPYDMSKKITKCSMSLGKTATINDVRNRIATLFGVSRDSSTFVMLSAKTFDRFLCRDQLAKVIRKMQSSHLYVQEINPKFFNGPENETVEVRRAKANDKKEEETANVNSNLKEPMKNGNLDDGTVRLDSEEKKENKKIEEEKKEVAMKMNNSDVANMQGVEEEKGGASIPKNNDVGIQASGTGKAGKKTVQDHDDYNNGLSDDLLRVCLSIFARMKYQHWTTYSKERKTFNRLIYVKKSGSLKDLHMEVFHYLRPLLEIGLANVKPATTSTEPMAMDGIKKPEAPIDDTEILKLKQMSDEELFAKVFPGAEERNWSEKLKTPHDYPYELRFVNIADRSYFAKEKCFYCDGADCDDCIVPFKSDMKVNDLLLKIGKGPHKNDYYYYEHKYYNQNKREFELEIVFNEDKQKCVLDLEKLEDIQMHKDYSESVTGKGNEVSIYSCLDQFSNWETLDQNNQWYCTHCKESVCARKRMEVLKCPPILILHLKRFRVRESSVMQGMGTGGRLNTLVDFPLEGLDLTKYVKHADVPPLYDLYAVSNHYGSTGFGHYTAYAENGGSWHRFDDSSVFRVDASQVCSTAAYVLFYKRKDLKGVVDYETIKQMIPEGYKITVIEPVKKAPPPPPKESKQEDGAPNPQNGVENGQQNVPMEIHNQEQNVGQVNVQSEILGSKDYVPSEEFKEQHNRY